MTPDILKISNKKIFFEIIPSFLTIFLPFFLITGPFMPDFAISMCSILFLINTFVGPYSNFKVYYSSIFFKCFIIFWITLVISSLLSSDIFYSLKTSFFYIRFGFFVLSTWFLLDKNSKIIIYFFYVLLFSFTILIFDGFFQFFLNENIFGWKIIGTRVSSFFKDELILGSYLSRLLPIFFACLILFIQKKRQVGNFYKLYFVIIFILSEVLIFLSGERVAFFYLNFAALLILILSNNFKLLRLVTLLFSIMLIIIISNFSSNYKERVFDYTIEQMTVKSYLKNKNSKNFHFFSLEHENHFKSALLMFYDHKLIGIGPKLFRKNCDKKKYIISFESCTTHPHNTYIQLLAETGYAGFIQLFFYFLLLIFFFAKHLFIKIIKKQILFSDFQLTLMTAIAVSLWPLIPTGNFFHNWLSVIYFLPIGFLLFSMNNKKKRYIE